MKPSEALTDSTLSVVITVISLSSLLSTAAWASSWRRCQRTDLAPAVASTFRTRGDLSRTQLGYKSYQEGGGGGLT